MHTFRILETASSSEFMHSTTYMGSLKDHCSLIYIPHIPGIAKTAFNEQQLLGFEVFYH